MLRRRRGESLFQIAEALGHPYRVVQVVLDDAMHLGVAVPAHPDKAHAR